MFADGRPTDFEGQIRSIDGALGLSDSSDMQDWGVEQSDANRLAEFIWFFKQEDSPGWHEWVIYEYVDLVLQSANDVLDDHPDAPLNGVRDFLAGLNGRGDQRIRYWLSP